VGDRVVKAGLIVRMAFAGEVMASRMLSLLKVSNLKGTTRLEDAIHLAERGGFQIGWDVMKHERGQHGIERGIGERKLLRKGFAKFNMEVSAPRFLSGSCQSFWVGIDTKNFSRRVEALGKDCQVPCAAANLEYALVRLDRGLSKETPVSCFNTEKFCEEIVEGKEPVTPCCRDKRFMVCRYSSTSKIPLADQ